MLRNHPRLVAFAGFYALALLVSFGGGYFTQLSVTTWYVDLHKSSLTPPGMYFGIVWTALYLLMSVAAERVHHRTGTVRCHAIRWWVIQLILGLDWCIVFFGERDITRGLVIILCAWVATLITLYWFKRADKAAAWMMLPLLLWLSFASYLNYFIWAHN